MQAWSAHCGYIGNKEKGWNKEIETEKEALGNGEKKFLNLAHTNN